MSEPRDERPKRVVNPGARILSAGFDEFVVARERYFETLRIDAEVRRLERMWLLPASGRESGRGSTA